MTRTTLFCLWCGQGKVIDLGPMTDVNYHKLECLVCNETMIIPTTEWNRRFSHQHMPQKVLS